MEAAAAGALVATVFGMMRIRPRVLFVGAFPAPGRIIFGGMVTSCRALLRSTFPAFLELSLLDSTQVSNPIPVLALRLLRAIVRFIRFIGRFERQRPHAVLLFVAVGASIVEKGAMAWYARLRGVPAVMFPRGVSIVDDCKTSAFTRMWATAAFRGARKIVCQGEVWQQFAVRELGFAVDDVAIVRNWTATQELIEIGARRTRRAGGPLRLLFVGWLEREKGIFELIEACRQIGSQREFILEIAGEGHASVEARETVTRYGLTELVFFRGWLCDADLCHALENADVFVLPSWAEGLPNAMVEAMAARLAVVVTSVGAIPDVITDRLSGLLVDARDAQSLCRALLEVIDNRDLRERMAAEAYAIAVRDFGVEAAAAQLVKLIDSTVAASHTRATSAGGYT
jgi:glycosyltransferase involved in cell wall biosynthesis